MNDDQLVDAFGNAALQAGKSNSGLCISATPILDWENLQKLRQDLKDRLKQLREIEDAYRERCNVD